MFHPHFIGLHPRINTSILGQVLRHSDVTKGHWQIRPEHLPAKNMVTQLTMTNAAPTRHIHLASPAGTARIRTRSSKGTASSAAISTAVET
jgi:hypothetical protein